MPVIYKFSIFKLKKKKKKKLHTTIYMYVLEENEIVLTFNIMIILPCNMLKQEPTLKKKIKYKRLKHANKEVSSYSFEAIDLLR